MQIASSNLTKKSLYLITYTANKAVIHPTTADAAIQAICLLLSFPPFVGADDLSASKKQNSSYKRFFEKTNHKLEKKQHTLTQNPLETIYNKMKSTNTPLSKDLLSNVNFLTSSLVY